MVDSLDSGSSAHSGRGGSSPPSRTIKNTDTQSCVCIFYGRWDLNPSKCRCPADICLPSAGRRQLLCFCHRQKRKSSPPSCPSQTGIHSDVCFIFVRWWDLNPSKCRCPVDICLPSAGRRQLLCFCHRQKRKSSPPAYFSQTGTIRMSCFLCVSGLEAGGLHAVQVKNMPVACFLAQGKVHSYQSAVRRTVK